LPKEDEGVEKEQHEDAAEPINHVPTSKDGGDDKDRVEGKEGVVQHIANVIGDEDFLLDGDRVLD